MNFKQKLVYMAFGVVIASFGLFVLIGCSGKTIEGEGAPISQKKMPNRDDFSSGDTKVVVIPARSTFKIRNRTGVTLHYQIKWSDHNEWQSNSLETDFIKNHWLKAANVSASYPKIRFDYMAGDQRVTYRTYQLKTVLSFEENSDDDAPTYFFDFVSQNELDLYKEGTEDGPIPRNGNNGVKIVYIPVNPVNKLSHDDSVKWLRDNGYSVETNNQTYIIRGQHGSNNTNMNISVGATVIGVPVFDKYSVNVGSLSIIDGKILVTINRKRSVK